MAVNEVFLIGRLTKDIDVRYSERGTVSARFNLAVDRPKQKGQEKSEADFINCVAFNKTAETLGNYTQKGSKLYVKGTIRTGSYENKQGQKVYTTDVWVNGFEFLDGKKSNTNQQQQESGFEQFGSITDEVDF